MLKITMRLDNLVWVELMYPKQFELYKLTNKYVEIIRVEAFNPEDEM